MSLPDPTVVAPDALRGVTVGLSVSDSVDLSRLGLSSRHADLAVAELTRAILLAGGSIAYGGWLRDEGVTGQLINEVERFATERHCLTLYVAYPQHCSLDRSEIRAIDERMGLWGTLVTLGEDGTPTDWRVASPVEAPDGASAAAAYSAHRRYMISQTDARILAGGKLKGYAGTMPGLIEEAICAVEERQPLYLAGGFGGAALAVAGHLGLPIDEWTPPDLPAGAEDNAVVAALDKLLAASRSADWTAQSDGLTDAQRAHLASTHRPGEIASLCVAGLASSFAELRGDN